jgi:alanine-glyoxylate transaminase / serine-glyoxylate transaminase / serine-pyruvate transaminase
VSARALAAAGSAGLPRSYWSWLPILETNRDGFYPYTPPISLLAGLHESVLMIAEETLPSVQARHAALADLTRKTIRGWGLDIVGPGEPHSNSLTAFWLPPGFDAAEVHIFLTERYGISIGKGLGQFAGRVLRVGHLGDMDVPTLTAALAALHSGLAELGALPASATAAPGTPAPGIATPGTADGAGTLPSPLGAPGEQAS